MFVSPLFLLKLSNSASYQKLASKSREKDFLVALGDYLHPKIYLNKFEVLCKVDEIVRDFRNLLHTELGNMMKNIRISQTFSIIFSKFKYCP
jgi:hypothetical protein